MLDNLTSRLSRVVKTMRGEARLTEANTQEMLREVRMALLEADVALPVVRDFVARVKESALGQEVWLGIFLVVMMELSQITPPVGLNLFVVQSIRLNKSANIKDVYLGVGPFVFAMILAWSSCPGSQRTHKAREV